MKLDENIVSAVELWYQLGIKPGSFTMALLQGKYEEARARAHPLLLPHLDDHIKYIEMLPKAGRGENVVTFEGGIDVTKVLDKNYFRWR